MLHVRVLLLLLCTSATLGVDVQEGAAYIQGLTGGACPSLRGYITFSTAAGSSSSYVLRLPNIDTACPNVGTQHVTVSVYSLSRSFSGDDASMFGSPNKANTLFSNAALNYPYSVLRDSTSGTFPSPLDMKSSSTNSIIGRSVVVSIGESYVAAGTIGRRALPSTGDTNTNTAGSAKLSGQSPTLLCTFSDSSMLTPTTAPTKSGSLVISQLVNSGGLVFGAKFDVGFAPASNPHHRISLHRTVHVPENIATKSSPTVAGAMLGPVLTYSSMSSMSSDGESNGVNLPCSSSARAGDLGNFQSAQYYARLPVAAGSGWEDLVGASCAVWKNPLRTCESWQVGCTSYDSTDELLAVGVVGLSDDGARLEKLGKELSSLSPPTNGGANYDCLGATTILATAHLYATQQVSSTTTTTQSLHPARSLPIATAVFVQSQKSSSVALSITLTGGVVPDWLTSSNAASTLRALSIQTTGDGSYGEWDGRTMSGLSGTFHPVASHQRALPPNALRRSGDLGNFNIGKQNYQYYMDTTFGERTLTLDNIQSSIVGRGLALHASADTGLGADSNRGTILAFGVLSAPAPTKMAQTNLARGPQLQQEQLICVLRNVESTSSATKRYPHGVVTIDLKHPSKNDNMNNRTAYVTVSGTFSNVDTEGDKSEPSFTLEVFEQGDSTGIQIGNPIGPTASETTACYELSGFGYLGNVVSTPYTTVKDTRETLLYSYLKPPQEGTLASLVGKSCVLSETSINVQKKRIVAVGVFALTRTDFEPLHVSNSALYSDDMLQDCHLPPNGVVKVPGNTTVNDGTLKESQVALIVGLAVGIPLGLCVLFGGIWSCYHYRKTHRTIKKTKSLRHEVSIYCSMDIVYFLFYFIFYTNIISLTVPCSCVLCFTK